MPSTRRSARHDVDRDNETLANSKKKVKCSGAISPLAPVTTKSNMKIPNDSGISLKKEQETNDLMHTVEEDMSPPMKKLKMEEDSDDSDMENVDVVEYIKRREENIRDNQEFFKKLGIDKIKEEMKQSRKPAPSFNKFRQPKPLVILPRRASLRLQNKTPEGVERPFVEPEPEPDNRIPPGPLEATEYLHSSEPEDHEQMKKILCSLTAQPTKQNKTDLDRYVQKLSKLSLTERSVVKVVPTRSFSLAFHPSKDRLLLASGDKWGKLGLLDVDKSNDGLCCYAPHSSPINWLDFPSHSQHSLYSCSYDCTLRCLDINKGIFQEIYRSSDEYEIMLRNFSFVDPHTLMVSQSDGFVAMVDTRTDNTNAESKYKLNDRGFRTVDVNPGNTDIFCTAGVDGYTCIWDRRKLHKTKNKSLSQYFHGKCVNSAFYSPLTGNKIVSLSMDNHLTVFTCDANREIESNKHISKNNNTGRWLTKFRAMWHPAREDLIVAGSMKQPREVSFYDDSCKNVLNLKHSEWLGSVLSLTVFHPTLDVVAGVNSSGRVHIFQ